MVNWAIDIGDTLSNIATSLLITKTANDDLGYYQKAPVCGSKDMVGLQDMIGCNSKDSVVVYRYVSFDRIEKIMGYDDISLTAYKKISSLQEECGDDYLNDYCFEAATTQYSCIEGYRIDKNTMHHFAHCSIYGDEPFYVQTDTNMHFSDTFITPNLFSALLALSK